MAEASSTEDVITLRIRFKSETLERFIERYGGDLGPDEVFVRTRQPLAGGTPIAFEFTLNDGSPLLDGRGTVIWTRTAEQAVSGDGPAGMGIKFTSLSAQSWQTLRKILAASGRDDAAVDPEITPAPVPTATVATGAPSFAGISTAASASGRRVTPFGSPAVAPATPEGGRDPRHAPARAELPREEEAERTEVARMPPNFFELAAEGGPRNLTPARSGTGSSGRGGAASADTPRGGTPTASQAPESFESLRLEDVEDAENEVEDATNVRTNFRMPSFGAPAAATGLRGTPPGQASVRPEPQWPTSPTPPTSPAVDSVALGLAAARTGAARSTSPAFGAPVTAGGSNPGAQGRWPSATPGRGTGEPPVDPTLSTSPTLPATAAVLLYDPNEPEGYVRAGQAASSAAGPTPERPGVGGGSTGPIPNAFAPAAGSSRHAAGMGETQDSSGLFFPQSSSGPSQPQAGEGMPPGYQTRLAQPGAEGPRYPEPGFEDARQSGFGPRPTVGRIGPAISPEEMALASSAVRGMENEAPLWPGQQPEDLDGPRGGTFKIWLALTLAAGSLIGGIIWLLPLMWPGIQTAAPPPPPASGEAAPGTPGSGGSTTATDEPAVGVANPAAANPGAASPGAAPAAQPARGKETAAAPSGTAAAPAAPETTAEAGKAAKPAPEAPVAKEAQPAPPARTAGKAPSAAARRAAAEADDSPRPGRRRVHRDPFEDVGEAAARDRGSDLAPKPATAGATATPGSAATGSGAGTGAAAAIPSGTPGTPARNGVATSPPPTPVGSAAAAPAAAIPAPVGTPSAAEEAEDAFWLSVRSTPSGADVLIDGQVEGKTPFQRRIFDPGRSYTLIVRKPGFTPVERTVSGSSDWSKRGNLHTLTVTAKLDPVPGAAADVPAVVPPPVAPPPASGKTNPFDEPTTPGTRP
jgi:uncharacterized protein (TIGR02266 family)